LPVDCQQVWDWFFDLMLTRQIGMADNPITYTEIDAYARLTGALIAPWEARAIVSLFWAYRDASPKPKSGKGEVRNETDAADGAGIKAFMAAKQAEVRRKE
jgi:hypothetical protein